MTTTVVYPELKLYEKSKTLGEMTVVKALGYIGAVGVIVGVGSGVAWGLNYWFEQRTCKRWGIEFEDNSWFLFLRDERRASRDWPDNGLVTVGGGYGNVAVHTLGTEEEIQMADNTLKPEEM
jgi:hypothetical protein